MVDECPSIPATGSQAIGVTSSKLDDRLPTVQCPAHGPAFAVLSATATFGAG
jgi:hypothetical protein